MKLYVLLLITGAMYSQASIQVQTGDLYGGPNFGRTYWNAPPVIILRAVTPKSSTTYDYHTRSFKSPSIELEIDSIVQQTLKQLNDEIKIPTKLQVSISTYKEIRYSMLRQSYAR